jgi:N-acetylmuramoyl-L-alanine amidase
MLGSPTSFHLGPLEFGPQAWSVGAAESNTTTSAAEIEDQAARTTWFDPEVRARGLQTRQLAEARAAFAAGEADSLSTAESLWVEARDPQIRDAALSLILDHARADLPHDYRGRFLLGLAPAVIRAGRAHKVPPSVTLGQAIIESGWGRSRMARVDNNLFGVKGGGRTVRSREFRNGRWTTISAAYRRYPDVDAAILHHAELMNGRHFRFARPLWTDWDAYLRAIAPKYASSPRYVSHVSSMVRLYDLHRWDALVARAAAWDAAHPTPDAVLGQAPAPHPSQG